MRWPIYLFGFILLTLGSSIVFNPEFVRKIIDFIDGIKWRLYSVGVLRLFLGTSLLLSAGNAKLFGFVLTFGILTVIGGVLIFAIPYNTLIKIIAWQRERSLITYRIMGIFTLIISSIFLFACLG